MYPRLPPESAVALAKRLRPMAMPADEYPLQKHPEVRAALIYGSEDELFEPDFERFMARELLGIDPIETPQRSLPDAQGPRGPLRAPGPLGE